MAILGTSRIYRPDPTSVGRDERWGRAAATATITTDSVVVAVRGELDASNATALAGYVERHAALAPTLILDLGGVAFFGTAGLAALRRIDLYRDRLGWMLLAGPAVRRVLRVCRAEDLPQAPSVAAARDELSRQAADSDAAL